MADGATTAAAPVTVASSERFDLKSDLLGRGLRILIARPYGDAPVAGWPVVYLLDGYDNFATAAQIARACASSREWRGAVVVGVAYADPRNGGPQRYLDLTTRCPQKTLDRLGRKDVTEAGTGGLDTFLEAIETEVKPAVEARVAIDRADQTLFGHSLGGLAVVRALFRRTGDYRTFLASSPSIWWDEKAVLADEPAFAARIKAGQAAPRVFICVGGLEETASKADPDGDYTQGQLDKMIRQAKMVGNAHALAKRLRALDGAKGYETDSFVFRDEGHLSVIPAALSRGLAFALKV
jgi:predicted alpha/beta superfamily hydrolase